MQLPEHLISILSSKACPQSSEDWQSLATQAINHDLLAYLDWICIEQDVSVPEPFNRIWQQATDQAKVAHMLRDRARREILKVLGDYKIEVMWIKGIVLADTVYPLPYLRPMRDIDLVVPFHQREQAYQILRNRGYELVPLTDSVIAKQPFLLKTGLLHHYHLYSTKYHLAVELHFQFLDTQNFYSRPYQIDFFWNHQSIIQTHDLTYATLSPEAHLLYLCAHIVLQHGEQDFKLVWYLDLDRFIKYYDIDWDTVVDDANYLGWSYGTGRALAFTQKLFDTPIPSSVIMRLRYHADIEPRFVDEPEDPDTEMVRLLHLLRSLSLRDQIEFIWRSMFPSQEYMTWYYRIHSDRAVWPYYLRRMRDSIRLGYRYFLTRFHDRPDST